MASSKDLARYATLPASLVGVGVGLGLGVGVGVGVGLGFGSANPNPDQVRRVFTPAGVFEPFERRGEPVPSALLRDAPAGSTQLLVGIASGFVPGAMALVQAARPGVRG